MQKTNIYQPGSYQPYGKAIEGWRTLTRSQRCYLLLLIGSSSLLTTFMIWDFNKLLIPSGIVAVVSLALWWLRRRDPQPHYKNSLLAALRVQDGKVWIGQQPLPDNLRKLVLGKMTDQGPAVLQLPWNQGHEWLFQINELPQVRQFLQQHLPHVQIIEE